MHPSEPYTDRDISWMYFNQRILLEAKRHDIPVLERLSFLGIYSNNLDEFFRVRMATISRIAMLSDKGTRAQRNNARVLFSRISDLDSSYSEDYGLTVNDVIEDLRRNNILLIDENGLDDNQKHYVKCKFRKDISGFIAPVWINRLTEFSNRSDDRIYLAVILSGKNRRNDYAVIALPSKNCGRFITLPDRDGKQCVMYLDDVVRFCLPMIFPGMGFDQFRAYSFKFTKDAEMEIDNDLHIGPLEKVAKAVKSRKKGAALRVIYDHEMSEELLRMLMDKLHLDALDTIKPSGKYHNHKDFMSFPGSCRKDLKYPEWYPAIQPELKNSESLLQLVAQQDRFIHVPYHSFDYLVRLLQEAAVSPNVKSIKITLYRVAKDSRIIHALIGAALNGKKVTAVVELLARFDESSNIEWAREMQEAGINVVFGVEGLKVHSKLILINMKYGRRIAVVGTGNFHEGNAKVYTDYFLMTADTRITSDVAQVFDFIRHPYHQPEFRHLLVSPNDMREPFVKLIDKEIANAKKGKEAFIKIKINHITDKEMVLKLYQASRAGVKIELLVRGNCSVVTGIDGYSENITAHGIIDRYLEHSRLFHFCNGGKDLVFMGSADWMPRNLDSRVEVITPVFDPNLKADIIRTIDFGMKDSTNAFIVDGTGDNMRVAVDGEPFRSQLQLHNAYSNEK